MVQIPKADIEKAKRMYPSTQLGEDGWKAFFDTPAGEQAMGRILGDIFDHVKAQEEKAAGLTKVGRRPRRTGTLEEVFKVVFPTLYTVEPFSKAVLEFMGNTEITVYAARISVDAEVFQTMLDGERVPSLRLMENIAQDANFHPSFFAEWRAGFMSKLVLEWMTKKPNLSVTAYKEVKHVA